MKLIGQFLIIAVTYVTVAESAPQAESNKLVPFCMQNSNRFIKYNFNE